MRSRMKPLLSILAGVATVVVVVLAGAPSAPAQAAGARAPIDPVVFAQGARLWAETCARCHNVREPSELRDDQWPVAVTHMRVRSGITKSEAEAIVTFLQATN
jgi:mono/diheme cytochrome c family protein